MTFKPMLSRLRAAFVAWRNARMLNPAFQRAAAAFPLTRPIARKEAARTFDLVAGFVYSQVLAAALQLGLLDRLRSGAAAFEEIVAVTGLQPARAERLLAAATSLGLTEDLGGGRHALGLRGAAILGNPGLTDMIAHHALVYRDLADPVALLRAPDGASGLSGFWPYAAYSSPAEAGAEAVAPYSALMAATQPMVAAEVLDACPLGDRRMLLDVGGGQGAFAIAAAKAHPGLRIGVFDLPAVADRARAAFAEAGVSGRAEAWGGDFRSDALPAGADTISLIRILHDHDDETALRILRAARAALPAGGMLVIGEPMSSAPRPDPMADAYFGFYLLAMGRGRARTPGALSAMAREAGFTDLRERPTRTPLVCRVLCAGV